jgi:ABC-type sugar transport system ATPase subunit
VIAPERSGDTPILELRGVTKSFGHVRALRGVDFRVGTNEIVGLIGDNGAGKSTLVKIMAGVHRPDNGEVFIDGQPCSFQGPSDALNQGIATVFQDLALVEVLDVARNVFLANEPTRWGVVARRRMITLAEALVSSLRIDLPSVRTPVSSLSGGQRQGVAVARAVHHGGRVFVMDEPTAALGVKETGRVVRVIRELRDKGSSVVVISHNLDLLFDVVDRFHVLRLGKTAGVRLTGATSREELVALITGARESA